MTPIEKWEDRIKLLKREQRYIEDDITDLQEKIINELKADQEFME